MKMSEIGLVSKLADFLRINEENEILEVIGNVAYPPLLDSLNIDICQCLLT